MDKAVRSKGRPNRGAGRSNRGRGRGRGRGAPRGRDDRPGWSASRKGGLDLDDSIDGPVVNDPYYDLQHNDKYRQATGSQSHNRSISKDISRGSFTRVKVEMQQLHMTKENQSMVRDTLLSLQSGDKDSSAGIDDYDEDDEDDEEEDDALEYGELDARMEKKYWIPHRGLVIQDAISFSSGAASKSDVHMPQENFFALKKLQRCGFSTEHCQEALQLCNGDTGAALEYLLNELFNISLNIIEDASNGHGEVTEQEVLEAREDEKLALQSIYDSDFEERIPNKTWVLNLKLPELYQLLECKDAKKQTEKMQKQLCPFYLKGFCKFKDKCRYSHSAAISEDDTSKPKNLSHPIYANLNAIEKDKDIPTFSIEFRFPEGNKYPHEPPLVAFSSTMDELRPHSRLNISQFLMSLAKDSAQDHLPCVFTLVSALEDKEKLEELLSLPPLAMGTPVSQLEAVRAANTRVAKLMKVEASSSQHVNLSRSTKQTRNFGKDKGDYVMDQGNNEPTDKENASQQNVAVRKRELMLSRSRPSELIKQSKTLQDEFKRKQLSKQYQNMQVDRQRLPAWDMRGQITEMIAGNQVVVICGMTGCGKTTQVPQFVLDEALQQASFNSNIICTQPRRISAVAVAQRVADERAEKLGRSVGYQIRLESIMSPYTRLLYCTTGIILRRLESDTKLEGVTHIIIDEVHERSEESDFLLMVLRDILPERRDLRLVLMSATLNAKLFSEYFGGCPILEIPGKTFPVQQFFLEDVIEFTNYTLEENSPYSRHLKNSSSTSHFDGRANRKGVRPEDIEEELSSNKNVSEPANNKVVDMNLSSQQLKLRYPYCSNMTVRTLSVMDLMKINFDLILHLLEWIVLGNHEFEAEGAILIFLPGYAEIQSLYDMLLLTSEFGIRNKGRYKIIPLHSTLSSEDQNSVFMKAKEGVTKIVIATNIAETSITIDDVVYVIDAGKMKEKRYDQTKSMESLETVWVSKANALQRKGRAGRVQEGVCFHLFTSHHFKYHLRDQPTPEIQRACLEQLVLKIKMLPMFGDHDVKAVLEKLIEPPSAEAVHGAVKRLSDLGALDENVELTPLGYHVGSLPVDVRIGKLMLFGAIFRCLDPTLTIAATLSFKTPFVTPFGLKQEADEKRKEFAMGNSDYLTVLNAYKGWSESREKSSHQAYLYCQENFLSVKTLQMLSSLKQQYVELLSDIGFIKSGIRLRDVERAARGGSDGVADITGVEANVNSSNWKLISAMLVAALYPNVVQVLTPGTRYHASISGAVMRAPNPEELKFKTKLDGYVSIHPSSVNFQIRHFASPYLVYHEKVKTTKVYIRDCSMVSVYPLLLFAGGSISIDLYQGNFILSVDDGWIQFMATSPEVAQLVRELRSELDQLLSDKISQPDMDLLTCPRGSKIINCIVSLISSQ